MELVLLAGFGIVVVGGWVWHYYSETRRDLGLEQVARRLGMNFRFGLPADLRLILPRFRDMERAREADGDFQAGVNSITGLWNHRKIAFFDYHWLLVEALRTGRPWWRYSDTGATYRTRHHRSAVAIEIGVALQPVIIRPERLADKAAALVGYDDIDFDRLPEFSDKFYVNSPDRVAARRLVTPALANFFLQHVRVNVDFVGPWILLHADRLLPADRVQELMEVAGRLGELVTREQSQSR